MRQKARGLHGVGVEPAERGEVTGRQRARSGGDDAQRDLALGGRVSNNVGGHTAGSSAAAVVVTASLKWLCTVPSKTLRAAASAR